MSYEENSSSVNSQREKTRHEKNSARWGSSKRSKPRPSYDPQKLSVPMSIAEMCKASITENASSKSSRFGSGKTDRQDHYTVEISRSENTLGACPIDITTGDNFWKFKVMDICGEEVSLNKYFGKVCLIVNIATS